MRKDAYTSTKNRRKIVGIVCVFGVFALGFYSAGFVSTGDETTTTALRFAVIVAFLAIGYLLGKAFEKCL